MAVYMILEIEVVDAETYAEYVQQAPATVEQYGGRYLVRGGRASRIQGFLGSLLNIKPIMVVREGETHPLERVRSRKRLLARFGEIVRASSNVRSLGFIHSVCRDDAQALAGRSSEVFPDAEVLVSEFSSVMGVHLGPGALGVAIWSAPERPA